MNHSGDTPAELDAGTVISFREPSGNWRSARGRAAFWITVGTSPLVLSVGWFWYGLAFFEEMTEQGKAIAASNTMAGFGPLVGGIPLILAHVFVLMFLLMIGVSNHSRRVVGVLLALVAVVIASALGIAVNQLVWSGDLFTMSADHAQRSEIEPPDRGQRLSGTSTQL